MLDEINENYSYIIDNQFIPNVNWFKMSTKGRYINFDLSERWKKMSFGNRCTLSGANGLVNLSVPIEKGRDQKAYFRDIKISYSEDWQRKSWSTIISCYNRAPFFVYYQDGIHDILFKKHIFLQDLNLEMINLCLSYLSINKEVRIIDGDKLPLVDSSANFLTPKTFQLDPRPITYHQMFMDRIGFQPNLSIIDLLFMEGPEAINILYK